jgi:hypothetical protein
MPFESQAFILPPLSDTHTRARPPSSVLALYSLLSHAREAKKEGVAREARSGLAITHCGVNTCSQGGYSLREYVVYCEEVTGTLSRTERAAMSNSDRLEWLAESARLTAFLTVNPTFEDLSGSWKALVGDEPDTVEVKPKERTVQESGPFHEVVLTFRHVFPGRVDWMIHPSEMVSESWAPVGKFPDGIQFFVDLMKRWLATTAEIQRLAFGAVLISPVSSRDEGYARLSGCLPFKVDLDSRNFMYQINRRRNSRLGIPGLEINRLLKWSCLERRMAQFVVSGTETATEESPSKFAVRLEADINTVPEYPKSLERQNLPGLFGEFVDLGAEIAEKGDIR